MSEEPSKDAQRRMASTLGALNRHAFLNVSVVTLCIQAEIQLVTE